MCLSRLMEFKPRYVGYKVVEKNTVGGEVCYYPDMYPTVAFKIKEWTEDRNQRLLRACNGEKYETGFHIFETLEGARRYCVEYEVILKVKYKKVVATGIDCASRVVVAKEIFPLKEIKIKLDE